VSVFTGPKYLALSTLHKCPGELNDNNCYIYFALLANDNFRAETTSAIRYSPAAQIPADQSSRSDAIQKKVIDWPISNHDPVSCTLKKKLRVIPGKTALGIP
jgi:hypothetical protein